jgi:YidC/Oxa1 family membrane protein insertase
VNGDSAEREIVVDTQTVHAVFSNKGARLIHYTLKQYKTDAGGPLELVPGGAGPEAIKPFTLAVDDPLATQALNNSLYRTDASETVDATSEARTISFEMATSDGLTAKKTFTFEPSGYILVFGANVSKGDQRLNPTIEWGPGLGDDIARAKPSGFLSPSYNTPAQPIYHDNGKVVRVPPATAGAQDGLFLYAGMDDHYFVSVVLNDQAPAPFHLQYTPNAVTLPDNTGLTGRYVNYSVRFAQPRDSVRFFFGPKAFDDLKGISTEMVRIINYGMFSWLAVPLLNALKWVHGYIGNWGWAIVVLTILINAAMFPLRQASMSSMRKMQEVQPQMKAIQDRYAKYKITDPERQKMNEEVMALYKTKGINPASGCVPMLLTFPFLFAFLAMLSQSIEIRGAHFAGWITNLSAPDPFYITPVLMGVAQFLQQKMTPTNMDPAQQKIMQFMPLMFIFASFSFPSGTVIYWLVSTVLAISQQYFMTTYRSARKTA